MRSGTLAQELCRMAADEIDRLRREKREVEEALRRTYESAANQAREIERLAKIISEHEAGEAQEAELIDRQATEVRRLREQLRLAEVERLTRDARLTDAQCDDVIAFLADYEWTGLTREDVRTWDNAIATARATVGLLLQTEVAEETKDGDDEPPDPDGEAFRGGEYSAWLVEQQAAARRLK